MQTPSRRSAATEGAATSSFVAKAAEGLWAHREIQNII